MKPLVIYHSPCWDGFCCAWLMHRYWSDECEFHPATYGDPPLGVKDRAVFVLDFSYPRDVLERMHEDATSLVVFDHHVSAMKDLEGLDYCTFDMDKSGAQLLWDWFEQDPDVIERPWLVDYTADRDLWRFTLPDSREVNAALRSYPLDFTVWDRIHDDLLGSVTGPPVRLTTEGTAILRAESQVVADHVARSREVLMDGYRVRIVNASYLFSEIAGTLAEGYPFGAVWFEVGGRRKWSLRSRAPGIDVSELARKHGGGGHHAASGFDEPMDTPLPVDAEGKG